MLLGIPKNAVDAVIKLDIQGVGAAQLAVKELLEKKRYACELAGQTQVKYSVQETLGDHPVHWNRPEASFDTVITAQRPQPCFQLRVITVSGKIWRSKPVFPEQEGVQKEQFNVFSASKHKVVTLQVPSSRITAIDYRFKPDYGNWLTDAASRMQDAGLGGGFQYLYPMWFRQSAEKYKNNGAGMASRRNRLDSAIRRNCQLSGISGGRLPDRPFHTRI